MEPAGCKLEITISEQERELLELIGKENNLKSEQLVKMLLFETGMIHTVKPLPAEGQYRGPQEGLL